MKEKDFKYIVGAVDVKSSTSAEMEFYESVDEWSAYCFISEFKYLENMGVKDLTIRINSVGGCVHSGMSIYNTILNSKMNVTTINDSVAMSMGSIIWSAGDVLKMRDISILMIHKPYVYAANPDDKDTAEYVKAMDHQLRVIYSKRFLLPEETVEQIMSGEEGIDGTYFTTEEAVDAGFLDASNIIETPAIIKNEISDILNIKDNIKYAKMVASVDFKKLSNKNKPKDKRNTIISQTNKQTKTMENLDIIASHLGLDVEKVNMKDVLAQITALNEADNKNKKKAEALSKQVDQIKADLTAKETELVASKQNVENLTETNKALEAKLEVYAQKEAEEQSKAIETLIDSAIAEGKIKEESRENWVQIATANLENATNLLNSITPAKPDVITTSIANDPKNISAAKNGTNAYEAELSEKIMKARGLA